MKREELESIGVEQFKRLLEISIKLGSTLDLKQLLMMVIDVARELTGTEDASMLLVQPQTGELHFVAASNDAMLRDVVVPIDSIAGWVVQNGQYIMIDDVQADARFYTGVDSTTQLQTRNMLAVPMRAQERIIGALEVLNKRAESSYTGNDVTLLQALASQAAVAIENARLFQQSDLIAEIMHELKTPLMAILSASELMQRQADSPEAVARLAALIQKEGQRMAKMTRDFLDLARLESGRMPLSLRRMDLVQVAEEVVRLAQPQAAERQIDLVSRLPATLPALVADPDRVQQLLLNLLSNAIKYNRPGGRVEVSAQATEEELLLSVADTGLGLPPESLERLFERFYRVPGHAQAAEGSGLGLTIARKIMEAHGGCIRVESELGKGSVFSCHFPCQTQATMARSLDHVAS